LETRLTFALALALALALAFAPFCAEAAPSNVIDDIAKEMTQQKAFGWEEAHDDLMQYARRREKAASLKR